MKWNPEPSRKHAFTRTELVITLVIFGAIGFLLLPGGTGNREPNTRIRCLNNLKQVALGSLMYAEDEKGLPEYREDKAAWEYFQPLTNYIIRNPKAFLCPTDTERSKSALNFSNSTSNNFSNPKFQNNALSYLYSVDETQPPSVDILAGDRNISTNAHLLAGLLTIKTNSGANWTTDLHKLSGGVAMRDGHVEFLKKQNFETAIQRGFISNDTQRFVIP